MDGIGFILVSTSPGTSYPGKFLAHFLILLEKQLYRELFSEPNLSEVTKVTHNNEQIRED